MRVWGRRLRVAIRSLAGKPNSGRARRAGDLLRQLTHTAGSGRDLDIMWDAHTTHFRQAAGEKHPAGGLLRRRLASLRRRGRARMVASLLDSSIPELRADVDRLVERASLDRMVVQERARIDGEVLARGEVRNVTVDARGRGVVVADGEMDVRPDRAGPPALQWVLNPTRP